MKERVIIRALMYHKKNNESRTNFLFSIVGRMLVNNYAACKVKEFIARCKGSESYTKNENTSTVVTQNPAETSKKGTGFSSRKGLGCISSSKNSACAESADLK